MVSKQPLLKQISNQYDTTKVVVKKYTKAASGLRPFVVAVEHCSGGLLEVVVAGDLVLRLLDFLVSGGVGSDRCSPAWVLSRLFFVSSCPLGWLAERGLVLPGLAPRSPLLLLCCCTGLC